MSRRRGFSLIELLVVIGIIVLLISIIVPVTQKVRRKARAVVCQANLKQWGTTFLLYAESNNGKFPTSPVTLLWLLRGSYVYEGDPNTVPFELDITTKGIACCPMATKPGDGSIGGVGTGGSGDRSSNQIIYQYEYRGGSTFEAWEIIMPLPKFRGSYGFNDDLLESERPGILRPRLLDIPINLYSLKNTDRIPFFLDSTRHIGNMSTISGRAVWPPSSEFNADDFCINRHDGYINGLFLDSSVRKIGLKELWTLKWSDDFDTSNRWTKAGGVKSEDWPEWMRDFKDY